MARVNRTGTVLLGILTTIMVGWVLHVGAAVLQPLVIALLLASMLQPVVRGLARWKIPPAVTVILIVTALFFGMAKAGILLQSNIQAFLNGQQRLSQTESQPDLAPAGVEVEADTESVAEEGVGATESEDSELAKSDSGDGSNVSETEEDQEPPSRFDPISSKQEERISAASGVKAIVEGVAIRLRESSLPEEISDYIASSLEMSSEELPGTLAGLATGLIGGGFDFTKGLLLVVIYMLFIFAEQTVFRRKILSVAGDRRSDAERVLDTIGRGIQRYLGVKTLVSFATGSLCYAVLVALEVPYALLFGFLTFLLNYIPTFGSIIAGILPVVTALANGATWNRVLAIMVTYLSVNIILGSVVEPRILGRELNLSPLVIIVSVVVWAALWGVIGTFLAVPLTAAAQIILASQENTRPIAVLLSSGPPKERPVLELNAGKRSKRAARKAARESDRDGPEGPGFDVNTRRDGA